MKKIKKNDQVIVIAGKDKGKRGTVKSAELLHAVVVGVNIRKKHTKPNPQLGVVGGLIEKEAPISISNIAIFNNGTQKADRVGFLLKDGKKVRVFKSNGEKIDS